MQVEGRKVTQSLSSSREDAEELCVAEHNSAAPAPLDCYCAKSSLNCALLDEQHDSIHACNVHPLHL